MIPERRIRQYDLAHWPKFVEKRGRCKFPGGCQAIIQIVFQM